jgi:hypothetical protein
MTFYPEDGSSKFLQNIVICLPNYVTSYPEDGGRKLLQNVGTNVPNCTAFLYPEDGARGSSETWHSSTLKLEVGGPLKMLVPHPTLRTSLLLLLF